ncbi:MAG: GNAT family N-acetyltransferase [Rikenellaceae bacterium]
MEEFRLATRADIEQIMEIVTQGQALLRSRGVDQWQDGYPTIEIIEEDIKRKCGFVITLEQQVAAYGALIEGEEPAYTALSGGEWLTQFDYLTLHRLTVSNKFRGCGIGAKFLEAMEREAAARNIRSLRADTHRDNSIMRSLLTKHQFTLCGDVYFRESHRFAYEKVSCH